MSIFTGAGVALVTPFKEDLSVDYDQLEKFIDFQIDNGTDSIVICGTSGEASTMSHDEQIEVVSACVSHVNGRVPVIAGAGANCTEEALNLAKRSEKVGADALLVVTPYYNKATQKGLEEYYATVGNSVDVPIIMYNVPGRTGTNIQPATAVKIAKSVDNIVAIKEASGDIGQVATLAALADGCLDIYSGNDDQVVPLLALGGKGVISVLSNVAPRETHDMVMKFLEGDVKGSLDIQLKYMDVIHNLFSEVNPIPAKRAVAEMGYCKNIVDVYYGGSEEEWKEMYIGSDNEYLKNATLHFNSIALPTAEFSVITEEDKVYVKNISEISGSIAVITTKYNDGILLDIQVERMIMLPSEEKYLFIPKNGRIFIWNSLKGMKPLSNEL